MINRDVLKPLSIAVLSLVAIVGIGLSIYFIQQNHQLSNDITNKNKQITDLQKQTTPPTSQSNIVTISKWGIQFQVVVSLADMQVKYYARTSNDHPPQEYYGFSTARVEALGSGCTTLPLSDIVTLQRFNEKPVATPDGTLLNSSPIGGYYYVASGPVAPCKAGSTIENQDYTALNESLKSITAIK